MFSTGLPNNRIPLVALQFNTCRLDEPIGFDSLLRLDSLGQRPNDGQYALPLPVAISVLSSAKVYETRDSVYYLLRFSTARAKSLSLHFNRFYLSPHAVLSLYADREISDSITARENNPNRFFASRAYHSNELNLVLRLPLAEKNMCELRIGQVFLGFQSGGVGTPGASQPCNVNLACPAGNGWQAPAHAVALITDGANYFTGTLVMNTCGTNIPYILTAEHVLKSAHTPGGWSFSFQFWSVGCDDNTPSGQSGVEQNFSGAQLRASSTSSDFALLELYQKPLVNSGLTYAGWTRQSQGIQECTILHHPQGDVMKVSHDNSSPIIDHYNSDPVEADCWRIDLDLGATEIGSSGAPWFDQNQRIFAQHEGEGSSQINQNPCLKTKKWGGRFSVSWFGGGTKASSLYQWLDPKGSGALTTNTTYVSSLISLSQVTGPEKLCTEATYTVGAVPQGTTVTWSSVPALSFSPQSPEGAWVKVSNPTNVSGTVTITASISPQSAVCGVPASLSRDIQVGKPNLATLSGSFTTAGFSTSFSNQNIFCLKTYNFPGFYSGIITVNDPMATAYSWQLLSTWHPNNAPVTTGIGLDPGTLSSYNVYVKPNGGQATYRLTSTNSCGSFTRDFTFFADGSCIVFGEDMLIGAESVLVLSPNPVDAVLTVSFKNTSKRELHEVVLYNWNGKEQKRLTWPSRQTSEKIDLSDLPSGMYILQVFDGQQWYRERIVKN
ncbi:MAG: T9SS type A sorting domain-containing protein [Sphingobacteriaceae bacterium]